MAGSYEAGHSTDMPPREIWAPYEAFYIHSMLTCTASAMTSFECVSEVMEALRKAEVTHADIDDTFILDKLQNAVLQAAALSRFFWPSRAVHHWRGDILRAAFSVEETSALKDRELRNAMEHFDERLDKYFEEPMVGIVLPHYVGPTPTYDVPGHIFRAFFTDRGVFLLLGVEHELQQLVEEVRRIHNLLVAVDGEGGRLPASNRHK